MVLGNPTGKSVKTHRALLVLEVKFPVSSFQFRSYPWFRFGMRTCPKYHEDHICHERLRSTTVRCGAGTAAVRTGSPEGFCLGRSFGRRVHSYAVAGKFDSLAVGLRPSVNQTRSRTHGLTRCSLYRPREFTEPCAVYSTKANGAPH